MSPVRHFLDLTDIPTSELRLVLDASRAMKARHKAGDRDRRPLAGKSLAMIFDIWRGMRAGEDARIAREREIAVYRDLDI